MFQVSRSGQSVQTIKGHYEGMPARHGPAHRLACCCCPQPEPGEEKGTLWTVQLEDQQERLQSVPQVQELPVQGACCKNCFPM